MHLIFRCLASLSINNSRNTLIYTFIWDEKKMSCSRNSHIFICIRSLQNTAHDRFIHYQSGKAKPWQLLGYKQTILHICKGPSLVLLMLWPLQSLMFLVVVCMITTQLLCGRRLNQSSHSPSNIFRYQSIQADRNPKSSE